MSASPSGMKSTARRLFRGLAGSYDRTVDLATLFQDRGWKKWVLEMLDGASQEMVLDIGCGTLLMEQRAASMGCKFVGIDLSDQMVRLGQRKNLGNVQLLTEGDAEALPFASESFDAVVSCYVAKYVELGRFAAELARVCKPGGLALVYDFARPVGILAPLLELYIQGGLRAVSFATGLTRRDSAFTFANLPSIVDGAIWYTSFEEVMEDSGFKTLDLRPMTGGVVYAYAGTRNGMPKSRGVLS